MDRTIFISNNSKNRSENVNAFLEVLNKRVIKQKDNKNMNTIFEKKKTDEKTVTALVVRALIPH